LGKFLTSQSLVNGSLANGDFANSELAKLPICISPGIPTTVMSSRRSRTRRREGIVTTIIKNHTQEPGDIEARVSTLEAASDVHAAAISDHGGLLVSMDEDISKIQVEFRAQRGMLQALHDTQSEHSTVLRGHTALLKEHSTILKEHGTILKEHSTILKEHSALHKEHRSQLAELRVGVQTIIDLLTPKPGTEN
jgi:hypothetical protein